MSVEFVSHMTRSFALSTKPTHVERAMEATANMGSAVSIYTILKRRVDLMPNQGNKHPYPVPAVKQ